jgi:hypothetical protein
MLGLVKRRLRAALRRHGDDELVPEPGPDAYADLDEPANRLWEDVRPFTMTSRERVFALRSAVEYVVRCGIPGDFVECGVWKGGSARAMARTLLERGVSDRDLYMFDTFDGMPPPTDADVALGGTSARELLDREDKASSVVWALSPLDDVRRVMEATGYPMERVNFVKGMVEETIPSRAPTRIALLRLDTDWYESTYHELVHLYPRLSVGGVLIIDDYGHWAGARRAVDQYIEEQQLRLLLHRIDYTGRASVKLE